MGRILQAAAIAVATVAALRGQPAPEAGPPGMLPPVAGTLVTTRAVGGIEAVDLPSLRARELLAPGHGRKAVYDIAGPDAMGGVAYVTEGDEISLTGSHSYVIHLLGADGADRRVVTGPGNPLWDHAISPIALSPRGDRIAFVAQPVAGRDRRYRPLVEGPLQTWDSRTGAVTARPVTALNQRPSWFPDGRRLAYVAPAPGAPEPADGDPPGGEARGGEAGGVREPAPVVHILDVESGADRFLAKGRGGFVSSDGLSVLVERGRGRLVRIDVQTGAETALPLLRGRGHPVALIAGRWIVLYGRPGPGSPAGQTANNSPLVGPKPLQEVRLVDASSGESTTLIPQFDPRMGLAVRAQALP